MTLFLVNIVIISRDGSYTRRSVSKEEFIDLVREADDTSSLLSRIGVPVIAEHVRKLTGLSVEVSEEEIELVDGDQFLVCQHTPLVNPTESGEFPSIDAGFVYFAIRYRSYMTRQALNPIQNMTETEKQRIRNEVISELLTTLREAETPVERAFLRERLNQWIEKRLPVREQFYTIDALIVSCFPLLGPRWRHNRRTKGDFDEKLHRLANSLLKRFTPWEIVRQGGMKERLQLVIRK